MNAAELSERLADRAADVAQMLLPDGKKASGEWKAGDKNGNAGDSLSVRISGGKRGVWKDFATGEGGDLIDLWAAVRGLTISETLTQVRAYLGVRDERIPPPARAWAKPDRSLFKKPSTAVVDWLKGRGLTEQTIAAFKVAQQERDGKTYAVFPYLKDGALINTKIRNVAEKKDMRQSAGAEPCLFGWHLVDTKARTIAICEGEIDAMTLYQAGIPALSVNAGAGNHQWIESDWDRLEAFSTIYLCFDDDEPGKKGAVEVAQRLGNSRCRLVTFGAKDANQWLQEGAKPEQFIAALASAKTLDPVELRPISDFLSDIEGLMYPSADGGSQAPELRLGAGWYDWFRFRRGEVTVWTGYNGHGKSLALNQILLGLIEQGEKVCVFSGEMMPAYQGRRIMRQASGLESPTRLYMGAISLWLSDKLWLFDVSGSSTIKRLIDVFSYGAKRYGIRHFVIDSLMMTDVPEDGPGAHSKQKDAMQALANFAKSHQAHVHLVAHPRKGKDESGAPGKLDVAGSSKLTDGADNVITVWSARREENDVDNADKPDACIEIQKQRNGDVQHKKIWPFFDKRSMQYCQNKIRRPHCYVQFSLPSTEEGSDAPDTTIF